MTPIAVPTIPHGGVNILRLTSLFQKRFLEYRENHPTDANGFLASLGFVSNKDRMLAMSWWMGLTYPCPADYKKLTVAFGDEALSIFGA